MGYSNKRRRSNRKRARTLNALEKNRSIHHDALSSDESSLDFSHNASSSSTTFCTTHSHHTNSTSLHEQMIPNSIFLDDVNGSTCCRSPSIEPQVDENDHSQFSAGDTKMVDELLNYDHATPIDDAFIEEGDVLTHSTVSTASDYPEDFHSHSPTDQKHHFDEMTSAEIASFKIMSLLDKAGAPRNCYDRLVALLKKLSKNGFDVRKAINRETLMRRLGTKYTARPQMQTCIINKQEVFRFKFQDMLQDILDSSCQYLHNITPNHGNESTIPGSEHELWNTQWMTNTFTSQQYQDFDPNHDIMLPIILYMDKTGTDVNQRYSLEPVLFSLAAIPREQRESRQSWRHLGFLPQKLNTTDEDDTVSSLQFYHDCLYFLLDGMREAQKNPPTVSIKVPTGNTVKKRALLPLMVVMGDQLSQDTLCGRLKSNAGGAGRVHRGCMCSYLNVDDPYNECKSVNMSTLHLLTTYATTSDEEMDLKISSIPTFGNNTKHGRTAKAYLQKQRGMFRSILRHPYTTHPIKNAFTGINFGSWSSGIHDATFDDFMHSVEAGMIAYITETVYDGLTKKEKETVEDLTRQMLDNQRCSTVSTYPRWRLQPGFTRQTLMTSGERVGSVLALSLSLQDPAIRETIRQGHFRQIQKYLDLSPDLAMKQESEHLQEGNETPKFYLDHHMHQLDDHSIRHTLEHMVRHGFAISVINELDLFQINQMIWHCHILFKTTQYPDNYPSEDVDGSYNDMGTNSIVSKELFRTVKKAFQTPSSKLFKSHRRRKVEGATGKHFKKKANKKGEGSSAAVLSTNMGTLVIFLEYVLCYHSFCKYSWSLPLFMQRSHNNIKAGNRFIIEYFQKLLYRGNNTVDSRFPKIHAQCRMSANTETLNTVMNSCCETGERLLKTEAKGISRTAQQRGNTTFLTQTMSRLQDRSMLDRCANHLEGKNNLETPQQDLNLGDRFARTHPHFVYDVELSQISSVNRKNECMDPDSKTGYVSAQVLEALKSHEPLMKRFEIYNEVVLRDNSRVRASPNYANSGPWYDYANISWERVEDGVTGTYLLPARCVCFFRKETSGVHEIMALIHTVDHLSIGKIPGRTDTLLTRHYRMQYNNMGVPVMHVIPVASIDSAIRCFPHVASNGLFDRESAGITYLLPRNHWAYMWMAMNDVLLESNSDNKVKQRKGTLVSLCNSNWLDSVRQRYEKYLKATCNDDL
jgi:hypothetical protein